MIRSKTPTRAASSVDPFAVEPAAVDWIRERERDLRVSIERGLSEEGGWNTPLKLRLAEDSQRQRQEDDHRDRS